MVKQVLFIQGAGEGAHEADAKLAASLKSALGPGYIVHFPKMSNESSPDYAPWKRQITELMSVLGKDLILVGHSAGGSILLKVLMEKEHQAGIASVSVVAAPFWSDQGWKWEDAELPKDAGARLSLPLFLYHSRDDEEVPYAHADLYRRVFPRAKLQCLSGRNHQLNDDLSEVAADIRRLD